VQARQSARRRTESASHVSERASERARGTQSARRGGPERLRKRRLRPRRLSARATLASRPPLIRKPAPSSSPRQP
jgi:hypothetical protein